MIIGRDSHSGTKNLFRLARLFLAFGSIWWRPFLPVRLLLLFIILIAEVF